MDIRDQGVVVTGAGKGLGAALGLELAARGAKVVLVARTASDVEAVAAEVRSRGGVAHALAFDVSDKRAPHRIAGAAAALVGPVSLLVNNASTLGHVPLRLLLDTDCEAFEDALAVNLVGPFRLAKVLAGAMAVRGGGVVLNVTSDASVQPYATWGAYGVSKAALDHLGRIWDHELAGSGVRVIAVDPGEMRTQMHADAVPEADPATLPEPATVARWLVSLLRQVEAIPRGARVEASAFAEAS